MNNRGMISAGQLFVLLFISRVIVTVTYSPELSSGDPMWNHLLPALISFPITLLMLIPVLLLRKQNSTLSVLEYSEDIFKRFSVIIILFYALYFLLVCGYGMALYNKFISLGVNGEVPIFAVSAAVVVASCYGAFKGIEAMARASGIILFGLLATFFLFVYALVPSIEPDNYISILSVNGESVYNGTVLMISRMSCIPALAVLYPIVKGNVKRGSVLWTSFVFITMMVFIIIVTGSLGDYLRYSVFPVYQAAKTVNIGFLQRLDALFIGLWTAGLFCRLSLFLYLFALCIGKIFGKKVSRAAILLGGAAILIFGTVTSHMGFDSFIFNSTAWLWLTLTAAVIIPLILLFSYKIKNADKTDSKIKSKRNGIKSLLLLCIVGGVVLLFSGCMSRAELNERVIIEGIGIDELDDNYTMTMMVLSTESSEEAPPPDILKVTGGSVSECFDNAARSTGRQILLSDNRFIIMNRSAAEKADEVLSYFDNSFEARPDILLYVAEESSEKLLNNEKVLEAMSAEDIAMICGDYSNGGIVSCRFKEFKASDNSGLYDVSIPILKLSDDNSRIIPNGSALFENGKMSGLISADESVILSILSDNADGAVLSLSEENKSSIPIEIVSSQSENGIKLDGNKFIYSKDVSVLISFPQSSELPKNKKSLEKIEEFLKKKCIQTVNKAVSAYGSDILMVGKTAQNSFYSYFIKLPNWHDALKDVEFNFNINAEFENE